MLSITKIRFPLPIPSNILGSFSEASYKLIGLHEALSRKSVYFSSYAKMNSEEKKNMYSVQEEFQMGPSPYISTESISTLQQSI
jgi:hypothetical protein